MKRMIVVLLVATLAGCISETPGLQTTDEVLSSDVYGISHNGQLGWRAVNGTATVLLLDATQQRIGSLFVNNETFTTISLPGSLVMAKIDASLEGVEVQGMIASKALVPTFETHVLGEATDPFSQITGPITGPAGIARPSFGDSLVLDLKTAPLYLEVGVVGSFANVAVAVESPRGLLYEGFEQGNEALLLLERNQARYLNGHLLESAIDGTNITIQVEADALDGVIILESIGYELEAPIIKKGTVVDSANIGFKFGILAGPSRVELHPDAKFLFLETDRPNKALVYDMEGNSTAYSWNGTLRIAVDESKYAIVAPYGGVAVGTDLTPSDFEMIQLPTYEKIFTGPDNSGAAYSVQTTDADITGIPFQLYSERNFQSTNPLGDCLDAQAVHFHDGDGHTYGFDSLWYGSSSEGYGQWNGAGELTFYTPSNNCFPVEFRIHSFTL